jgi:hypothetical protein
MISGGMPKIFQILSYVLPPIQKVPHLAVPTGIQVSLALKLKALLIFRPRLPDDLGEIYHNFHHLL